MRQRRRTPLITWLGIRMQLSIATRLYVICSRNPHKGQREAGLCGVLRQPRHDGGVLLRSTKRYRRGRLVSSCDGIHRSTRTNTSATRREAMSQGPSGLCKHVWETKCRTCWTDIKHWPECREMSAGDLLDELVRRANMQEQINGGAWGVIAAWLEEHRVMLKPSRNAALRDRSGK